MKLLTILLQAPSSRGFINPLFFIVATIIALVAIVFFVMQDKRKILHDVAAKHNYRYPALRIIASIYKILAVIIGIIALGTAAYFFKIEALLAVITLVVGTLIVLGLLAVSESIIVFLDIEQNTRETAQKQTGA